MSHHIEDIGTFKDRDSFSKENIFRPYFGLIPILEITIKEIFLKTTQNAIFARLNKLNLLSIVSVIISLISLMD